MHHLEIYAAARGKRCFVSLLFSPPPPPFKLRGVKECAARSNNVQNTAVAASIARPQGRPSLTLIFFSPPWMTLVLMATELCSAHSVHVPKDRSLHMLPTSYGQQKVGFFFKFCFFLLLWSRQSRSEMTSSCLRER